VAEAPLPTETVNVTSIGHGYGYPWWLAKIDDEDVAQGNKLGYVPLPGACPDTLPTVTQWYTLRNGDYWSEAPADVRDDLFFSSRAAGVNCLIVTALDWFGWTGSDRAQPTMTDRHGPVEMMEFVDDGPPPPTVGTPTWDPALGRFEIPVSDVDGDLQVIYDPSDPTTCPPPGGSSTQAVATIWAGDRYMLTPPVSTVCLTFYNVSFDGPVPVGPGTPVNLTVPSEG
jgi:hypothetical protein